MKKLYSVGVNFVVKPFFKKYFYSQPIIPIVTNDLCESRFEVQIQTFSLYRKNIFFYLYLEFKI